MFFFDENGLQFNEIKWLKYIVKEGIIVHQINHCFVPTVVLVSIFFVG